MSTCSPIVWRLLFSLLAHLARKHRPPALDSQFGAAAGFGPHHDLVFHNLSGIGFNCVLSIMRNTPHLAPYDTASYVSKLVLASAESTNVV